MTPQKIMGIILIDVIGLALLPVLSSFVTELTGTTGAYVNTTTGSLIDLIPVVYVILLVVGNISYVKLSHRG